MRLDAVLQDRLDQWASEHGQTRAEAARELILLGLDRSSRAGVSFSDGEKLIIAMIADLNKDPKQREVDAEKVLASIYGGHLWALKWDMSGLFHDHVDTPGAVSLVVDTLDAWSFIEEAVERFTPAERSLLEKNGGAWGKHPQFFGFDGNNESQYLGIARHLVDQMDRFQRFKGRELNSHLPVVSRYAAMTKAFQPIRSSLSGRSPPRLTLPEVIMLLKTDAEA